MRLYLDHRALGSERIEPDLEKTGTGFTSGTEPESGESGSRWEESLKLIESSVF